MSYTKFDMLEVTSARSLVICVHSFGGRSWLKPSFAISVDFKVFQSYSSTLPISHLCFQESIIILIV